MSRPGAVWTLVLLSLSLASPVATQERLEVRVSLGISCKDNNLKNRLSSFVARELRQLGDVVLLDERPGYRLAIAASTKGGYQTGYALSVVITQPLTQSIDVLFAGLAPEYREAVNILLEDQESFERHQLLVGRPRARCGSRSEPESARRARSGRAA